MPSPELTLGLEERSEIPTFLKVARALAGEIQRGRWRPGQRLPSSRKLAVAAGVNRNTVVAGLGELESEGWISTRPKRGVFVALDLPEHGLRVLPVPGGRPSTRAASLGFDLARPPSDFEAPGAVTRGALALSGGIPDVRLVPVDALARAYRRALRKDRSVLEYGDPRGHERLRRAIVRWLAETAAIATDESRVIVTRGSQMGLDLAARCILRPGDRVAIEAWGYRPAWEALERAGATLVPIPVDDRGMVVEHLERALPKRLRAIYVTPHHQYPTTVTMSVARRGALLDFAARERIAILEDDYDHEFQYEGRPAAPLASADQAGVVVYIGTLSKILAPGLRIGCVVAPEEIVRAMAVERSAVDRQGDRAVEAAVAELFEDDEIQRHARRMRRIYRTRRDHLARELRSHLGGVVEFEVPPGGMALWAHAPGVDVDAWSERARARGVLFYSGKRFAYAGEARGEIRLGFAALDEGELSRAVQILRDTVRP